MNALQLDTVLLSKDRTCLEILDQTLLPGTIIATGTPAGVGMGFDPPKFLKPGDVVECEIAGIGVLRNTVE